MNGSQRKINAFNHHPSRKATARQAKHTEGTEKCEGRGNFIVVFCVTRPSWSGLIFFFTTKNTEEQEGEDGGDFIELLIFLETIYVN